jgi:hypothetical protein
MMQEREYNQNVIDLWSSEMWNFLTAIFYLIR